MSVGLKHLDFHFQVPGLCVYYEDNQIIMETEINFLKGLDPKEIDFKREGGQDHGSLVPRHYMGVGVLVSEPGERTWVQQR